ncbi:hypothetical protein [Celerinatantimonas yamalensis]|uniref:Uncharacterized protein n=1 Tax=Celerinatantimonas yamalensis TaxID=559956 RepID=A0ABW9G5K5_9GAMM
MKKECFGAVGMLLLISCSSYASEQFNDTVKGRTYMQYEHDYLTTSRRHTDSIKIVHQTKNNWHYEAKFGTYSGKSDQYVSNEYGGSAGFVLQYTKYLDRKTYFSPSLEIDLTNNGVQYLAGASVYRKLTKNWGGYVRYRYQYRRISRSDKYSTRNMYINGDPNQGVESVTYLSSGDIGTHRFETGIDYSGIRNWRFTYILLYDYAKYINSPKSCSSYTCTGKHYYIYDNKHGYLYNELKVQYYGYKKFIPYFEVDQKSASSTSKKHQAVVEAGFNWYF